MYLTNFISGWDCITTMEKFLNKIILILIVLFEIDLPMNETNAQSHFYSDYFKVDNI